MITVRKGDVAEMRDGRTILVTDAADQHPDAYRVYSYKVGRREDGTVFDEEYIVSEMPKETIFMGHPVGAGLAADTDVTIVSDMSEVVSILT
jgi:hypothetical protein